MIAYNDGRDFFYWMKYGIELTDKRGSYKQVIYRIKDVIGQYHNQWHNSVLPGETYTEKYTGNKIILSKDNKLVATIQSIPSREDIDEPSFKVDIFARSVNDKLNFTSMTVIGETNITSFIDTFIIDTSTLIRL